MALPGRKPNPYYDRNRRFADEGLTYPIDPRLATAIARLKRMGAANPRTGPFRESIELDPSRVVDARGMEPEAYDPLWDLIRGLDAIQYEMKTDAQLERELYEAQQRAARIGQAGRRISAERTANPFVPTAHLDPTRVRVAPPAGDLDRQLNARGARQTIRVD